MKSTAAGGRSPGSSSSGNRRVSERVAVPERAHPQAEGQVGFRLVRSPDESTPPFLGDAVDEFSEQTALADPGFTENSGHDATFGTGPRVRLLEAIQIYLPAQQLRRMGRSGHGQRRPWTHASDHRRIGNFRSLQQLEVELSRFLLGLGFQLAAKHVEAMLILPEPGASSTEP